MRIKTQAAGDAEDAANTRQLPRPTRLSVRPPAIFELSILHGQRSIRAFRSALRLLPRLLPSQSTPRSRGRTKSGRRSPSSIGPRARDTRLAPPSPRIYPAPPVHFARFRGPSTDDPRRPAPHKHPVPGINLQYSIFNIDIEHAQAHGLCKAAIRRQAFCFTARHIATSRLARARPESNLRDRLTSRAKSKSKAKV